MQGLWANEARPTGVNQRASAVFRVVMNSSRQWIEFPEYHGMNRINPLCPKCSNQSAKLSRVSSDISVVLPPLENSVLSRPSM